MIRQFFINSSLWISLKLWTMRNRIGIASSLVLSLLLIGLGMRAQETFRQSQCENNLKQISLGLHNYHAAFDSFPYAAFPNDRLAPDQRLSWQLCLLPQMFCSHCWGLDEVGEIQFAKPWNAGPQRQLAVLPLGLLLCPSSPYHTRHGVYSGTHPIDRTALTDKVPTTYVGIAGVGKDAAFLKKGDPKCGIFGYHRVTRLQEIRDGAASTMMVAETSELQSPWTSGGSATVRGLDPARLPYLGKTGNSVAIIRRRR